MRCPVGMLGALVALSLTLPAAAAPLRVVAAGGVPFLVETPGEPISGLSLDVWSLVAEQAGLEYEVVR